MNFNLFSEVHNNKSIRIFISGKKKKCLILADTSGNAWNLNENALDGWGGGYWFVLCESAAVELKLWTAENILPLFCEGKIIYRMFLFSIIKWGNYSDLEKSQVISGWRVMDILGQFIKSVKIAL